MGCGYDVGVLRLLGCVFAAFYFCICIEDVTCYWFGEGVGVVSDHDRGLRCAWGCSCARIGTFGAIGLYITSGKRMY